MHALSELLSEGEPLARKSPGALAALARRLLRTATHLATRLRGNAWLASKHVTAPSRSVRSSARDVAASCSSARVPAIQSF